MKYKLVPGKWCSECCFGTIKDGLALCWKGESKKCIPGQTVYAAVLYTNGDRIRSMSNEELAHFIDKRTGCPPENGTWTCAPENCQQCWLAWLNAEAESETEGETSK